jgi:hypothetical protein
MTQVTTSARPAVWLVLTLLCASAVADARQLPPPAQDLRPTPVSVYLDCKDIACDLDYFQTEIIWVTYVRERQDADVHVLIIGEPTAAGGTSATLNFIGQREFEGVDATVRYIAGPADTEDVMRAGLANALMRGLVQYANRTQIGENLTVLYIPSATRPPGAVEDPWNFWTFSASVNGFFSGEERLSSRNLSITASASRTTETWKIITSGNTRYSSNTFDLGGDRRIESTQRTRVLHGIVVRSVTDHVSVGGRGSATSSTFVNQDFALRVAPALEFNVFPYRESTRRMLTVEYSAGANAFDYVEETIFGKTAETVFDHRLLASLRLTQRWGSISAAVEGSHYLHDLQKNSLVVFGSSDWNIVRGLSIHTFASVERVRDQLYLSARGASQEEILLRQRQLATSYSYSGSIGISYRFGSPFAHVVNPRFAGSMGGTNLMR